MAFWKKKVIVEKQDAGEEKVKDILAEERRKFLIKELQVLEREIFLARDFLGSYVSQRTRGPVTFGGSPEQRVPVEVYVTDENERTVQQKLKEYKSVVAEALEGIRVDVEEKIEYDPTTKIYKGKITFLIDTEATKLPKGEIKDKVYQALEQYVNKVDTTKKVLARISILIEEEKVE